MDHYKLDKLLSKIEMERVHQYSTEPNRLLNSTLFQLTVEDLKTLSNCLTFESVTNPHPVAMVNPLVELLYREINKSGILKEYET